ncbi:transposase [Polyangium mundeleinium]|uniref:transposase n=1 Tax=Polyangium mundeleinium TaxID=2995306 RepID=UPI00358DBE89
MGAFVEELLRSYRWRARRMFGLSSVEDAFPGAVTVIQRFDSALRLNVHAHTLVLDGVWVSTSTRERRSMVGIGNAWSGGAGTW